MLALGPTETWSVGQRDTVIDALDRAVERCLADFSQRRHIVNLGHGVTPATPPDNVGRLISKVRGSKG